MRAMPKGRRGRRGRCVAPAGGAGPETRPRTQRSHELKELGHVAANPRDTALLLALPKNPAYVPIWVSKNALVL